MKKILFFLFIFLCIQDAVFAQKNLDNQMRKLIISAVAVNDFYADSVNTEKLVEDAIRGMLEKLDPHSQYSTVEETKRLNEPLQGSFDGIGVQFNILDDTLIVVQTITNGPSEKAGIMPGDRIISVNDTTIAGVKMPQEEIVKRLRGPRKTHVRLGVLREGLDEVLCFDVIRDKIPLHSVDAAFMITSSTGLVRFSNFAVTTHAEVVAAIERLKALGMSNLIIDLTQNGGGYLQASAEIASEFLPEGDMIVYTNGRAYKQQEFRSRGGKAFQEGKIIVLVDEYSASASEILAGAIQDQDRGLVVGRRTFGKGLVQRPIELPDGSMIRLTISRYYTPSGRCIQKPYEKGKKQDYQMDVINRFNRGELTNVDSIHFPDSLKYQTLKKGRTVYGGGGIMPDYFVPLDTTKNTKLYRQILAKRILVNENLRFMAKHRKELLDAYPTFEVFREEFQVPEYVVANVVLEGRKSLKEEIAPEEELKTINNVRRMLKALIARDLWDMNEYFAIIYEDDDMVLKALEIIGE